MGRKPYSLQSVTKYMKMESFHPDSPIIKWDSTDLKFHIVETTKGYATADKPWHHVSQIDILQEWTYHWMKHGVHKQKNNSFRVNFRLMHCAA